MCRHKNICNVKPQLAKQVRITVWNFIRIQTNYYLPQMLVPGFLYQFLVYSLLFYLLTHFVFRLKTTITIWHLLFTTVANNMANTPHNAMPCDVGS